jgi:serine protease
MKETAFFIFVLIISVVILSSCGNSGDLTKSINGTVLYGDSDSRVVEAEILLDGIKKAETDYYGQFFIVGLEKNNYELIIEKDGKRYNQGLVQPTVSSDLTFRIGDISGSTMITGKVNIFNETRYEADDFQTASNKNFKKVSNINKSFGKQKYVENEIIVKYDDSNTIESLSNRELPFGLSISKNIKTKDGNLVKINLPNDKSIEEMIRYFNQQPGVEYAEPNYFVYAQAVPNDDRYIDDQWGHITANLEAAWDKKKYSNSIAVAVLDTGIIPSHPDLAGNLLSGANFVGGENDGDPSSYEVVNDDVKDYSDESSHGTHVAGTIGALTNNNDGIAGVSWEISIIPVKVLNSDQSGTQFNIAQGIYYAVDRNADVINMSLGSYSSSSYLKEAVEYASRNGLVMVGAAGNDNYDDDDDMRMYPAAYPEVISVGALNIDGILTSYSNHYSDIDILAPGGDFKTDTGILSTSGFYNESGDYFTPEYVFMEGTSMSAAYVSGTVALLLEMGVNSSDIKSRLLNTASEYSRVYDNLDAYGAILGKRLEPPYVFAARTTENELIIESNSARSDINNNYTLYDELEGEYYMVAWRDVDNDEEISAGDYFGITSNTENLILDNDYNIDIDMYYVTESSNLRSLNVVNFEKLYQN